MVLLTSPVLTIFASSPSTCARRIRALRGAGETDAGACVDPVGDNAVVDDLRVVAVDLRAPHQSASWGGRHGTRERAEMTPMMPPLLTMTLAHARPAGTLMV